MAASWARRSRWRSSNAPGASTAASASTWLSASVSRPRGRGEVRGDVQEINVDEAGRRQELRLPAPRRRPLAAGNGHCTRPVALDCNFETICERCGFFETGPQFITILRRQRDHAAGNDQHNRAQLFTELLDNIDDTG